MAEADSHATESPDDGVDRTTESRASSAGRAVNEKRMTFGEHLEELRRRLIVSLIAVGLLFVVALIFQSRLFAFATIPYERARAALVEKGFEIGSLVIIRPTEGFIVHMKVAFTIALLIGAPILLQQMWLFIAAGLYSRERRAVMRILPFSILMFTVGLVFSYEILLPLGLRFLIGYSPSLQPQITASAYFGLLLLLTFLMGLIFQLPLVMSVLSRTGLVSPKTYSSKRRIFILGAFIAGALFTPPDPGTQILVALPMLGLYELGILLAKAAARRAETSLAGGPGDGGAGTPEAGR